MFSFSEKNFIFKQYPKGDGFPDGRFIFGKDFDGSGCLGFREQKSERT